MSAIRLYGAPMSSAGRSRWMIEECDVPYEWHEVDLNDEDQRERFRKLNPGGKIPFLVDGDVRLFESVAINFYLAERYAPALSGRDLVERAQIDQWSLWAVTNLQPEALGFMRAAGSPTARAACTRFLEQLEGAIGEHVVGDRFTVADVNVGSVVNIPLRLGLDAGPKVRAWMERMRARPAYRRATAR